MQAHDIEGRVKTVIAFWCNCSIDDLKNETKIEDDLGADSLDLLEAIMGLEDEFDIEISDEKAEKVKTVQDAIDLIKNF